MAEAAGKLPEIYEAEILQGPKTINNTKGVQGDLMISLDKPPADASLTSDGRLLLTVTDGEETKYRRDGADLVYDRTEDPELSNVMEVVGDQLLVAITCDISGRVSLTEFVDELTGGDPADVVRLFQVSADGIFWTEWVELTNEALQALDPITADGTMMVLWCSIPWMASSTQNSGVMPLSANTTPARSLNSVFTGPGQRAQTYTGLRFSRSSWAAPRVRLTT